MVYVPSLLAVIVFECFGKPSPSQIIPSGQPPSAPAVTFFVPVKKFLMLVGPIASTDISTAMIPKTPIAKCRNKF